MKEWTDIDYAQAAIDMLPGTVEEIEEFLRAQGIKNKKAPDWREFRSRSCPVAQWVNKWTEASTGVGFSFATVTGQDPILLPESVRDYIIYADRTV